MGVKSGAVSKADLRDTLELLRGLMDDADGRARSPSGPFPETQTSSAQRHDDSQPLTPNMGYANSNSASPDAPSVHPLLGERAGVRESVVS